MEWTYNLEDIAATASRIWDIIRDYHVIAFHGNMGSGKTTLIHALCTDRKVKDVVTSPTFSIINEYAYIENNLERRLYHIDLYRLKDEEEARNAGVEDCFYDESVCFVEWPERIPSILPRDTLHIFLTDVGGQSRRLQIGNN